MPEDKQLYTFRIEPSMLEALQAITEHEGVPVSEQIRRAIRMWLAARGVAAVRRSAAAKSKRTKP